MDRKILFLMAMGLASSALHAQVDIEGLSVEVYYISDANDATDTIGGSLVEGSRTYRVFLDLCADCSLRAIYGSADHPLSILSTAVFFNNLDRGRRFGHEVSNNGLAENTVALDSWLTMSAASTQRFGILKAEDPNGSSIGGANNNGGSAAIAGGLLVNDDPDAGIPLTIADGLVPLDGGTAAPPGFNFIGDDPAAVFGDENLSSGFITTDFKMLCLAPGVKGPTADNKILIAQLTTAGNLVMALNIEVQRPDGTVIKYVSDGSVLLPGEVQSGYLNYPPECGCMDPNYLEFDPSAACDDGSCSTTIVFGCMDTLACNYSGMANFNVAELCCYGPGNCNGLDITLACPQLAVPEAAGPTMLLRMHPNPASELLHLEFPSGAARDVMLRVYDATGRLMSTGQVAVDERGSCVFNVSVLPAGLFHLVVEGGGDHARAPFVKL